jgi:hypothetical protein
MDFFVGDVKTKAEVEVVDLPQQLFLLGTNWLREEKGIIDFDREELQLKEGPGIPIKFVEENESEEEYEEEYEDKEIYY